MMKLYRHSYFKYFCLLLLFAKALCYMIEKTSTYFSEEITCSIDINDIEDDCEEDIEVEEFKKVVNAQNHLKYIDLQNEKLLPSINLDQYLTQFLEYATPPPELA